MTGVRVTITRYVSDEPQPGLVEAQLVDAHGRCWSFIDKEPILSADYLDATSPYPLPGVIACEVVGRTRDAAGRELVRVYTARPWGVESIDGETRFEVPAERLWRNSRHVGDRPAVGSRRTQGLAPMFTRGSGAPDDPDRTKEREPVIRVAEGKDAQDIAQIYVDSWNAGFTGLMPHRQLDTELVSRWQQDIAAPLPHRWWVAEVAGVIVGFTGIGPSRDPVDPALGELDTIAVAPAMWRRGIGRALMSQALHYLMADGYCEAVLWTLAEYERGKRFYEAMGWSLDGGTRDEGRQIRYRHRLVL